MTKTGRVLRSVAIILMGLTAVVTLLGAVGTYCVAYNTKTWLLTDPHKFAPYDKYQWLYQAMLYIKLVVAAFGLLVTYKLVRGAKWAYAGALVALILGLATAAIQMFYTSVGRGAPFLSVAPTNMRFFVTVITLVFFLVIRFPGIWEKIGLGRTQLGDGSKKTTGGLALFLGGLVTLSTPMWAGPTHMYEGFNLVYVVGVPLMVGGVAMVVVGLGLFLSAVLRVHSEQAVRQESSL